MKKSAFIYLILILLSGGLSAQTITTFSEVYRILNSHSTEEFNNEITSYIRVVADHLTSDESGYTLNMSLIAFKDSSKWIHDVDYIKKSNRFLRHTQLSGGVTLKSGDVDDINGKIVFTLLNRRDSALYVLRNKNIQSSMLGILREAITKYKIKLKKDGLTESKIQTKSDSAFLTINTFNTSHNEKDLDKDFASFLNESSSRSLAFPGLTFAEAFQGWINDYNQFAKAVQRRPLLTLYPSLSFSYPNKAVNKFGLGTSFIYSLGRNVKKKPWDLDIEAGYNLTDDSTSIKTDLDNKVFNVTLGINKVFLEDIYQKPKLEFKLSGEYNLTSESSKAKPFINGVLKYKASENFWIPLTISYDVNNPNLFGFINATVNLDR